jgi:hydroxymethylbilane synthase
MNHIRVGTRGSKLALTQTEQVIAALRCHHPGTTFETVVIKTTGDMQQGVPFAQVGTKGMFVKEIEEALLAGAVDFAVHSLKDMPGDLAPSLALGAVPRREDARDALLSHGSSLNGLPPGARVGTSSLRRKILLQAARADLEVQELRGNLDTRIRKLEEGRYDAIVLACAGLERMGWSDRITERLSVELCIPAPGQGALALEVRDEDESIRRLLESLHHQDTADAVAAERAFQAALDAGCSVPAAAHATVDGDHIRLLAILAEANGSNLRRIETKGRRENAKSIGREAAERLAAG